jgi:UDP-N-acetylmuramate dehydrogenase
MQELASRVRGHVERDEPLARYTTYRIGGPAAAVVRPEGTEDVARLLTLCHDSGTRWLALGLGSNVLIPDRGFDGVVIRMGQGMQQVTKSDTESHVWTVGAGLPTPRLARKTARAGLAGVHRLIGVPGTVGGGVFMNAGAHGQEFGRVVRRLEVVDGTGADRTVEGANVQWRYRSSGLDGVIVTAATVEFTPGNPAVLSREIRQHFRWRRAGTPFDQPCCGSVFRNPGAGSETGASPAHDHTAGQLIDAAGLKGFQVGGAQVSFKHANYIVNVGVASAADVLAVIDVVQERVLEQFGVELELEIRIIT